VIIQDHDVALIRRERDGATYYVFPGGGVEDGESFAATAVREAYEELGVRVRIGALLRVLEVPDGEQQYFAAKVIGGTFGAGTGTEFSKRCGETRGRYTPVWSPIEEVSSLDLRPRALKTTLSDLLQRASLSVNDQDEDCSA
jgi:8-oxo-dGTP pyrophosphatase MutT (NUDIX family)